MLDTKIVGGSVIDGTGAPRRRADVGILGDHVVAVGEIDDGARSIVDATGLIVAPGFVDSHTHHDASLLWDPLASPSAMHGVTTVVAGNCGFTIAPIDDSSAHYVMRMLSRVEGMPLEALQAGATWDWESFDQYLRRFTGQISVNAAFLVGHSTLRRLVMGPDAVGHRATPEQCAAMVRALRAAVDAGARGFSSSLAATHHDGDGNPIPSRAADRRELLALAGALADKPGTFMGFNPGITPFDDQHIALITDLALAAGRPLTWNALPVEAHRPDVLSSALALADHAAARGAQVVAQVIPDPRLFYLSFANGFLFDALDGWAKLFALPVAERMAVLGHPDERRRLAHGAANPPQPMRRFFGWETMRVVDPSHSDYLRFAGRRLEDISRELDRDLFDTFFDLVVANGPYLNFTPQPSGDDDESWRLRGQLFCDPRMVVGAADAGAHLDNASSFTYTTSLLGGAVRTRGLLSLEAAVHALTEVPARLCQLSERGRLQPGCFADVVIFDADTIAPSPIHVRNDLPGGARRLYADARGIELVMVNGQPILRAGQPTGALPGLVV